MHVARYVKAGATGDDVIALIDDLRRIGRNSGTAAPSVLTIGNVVANMHVNISHPNCAPQRLGDIKELFGLRVVVDGDEQSNRVGVS